MPKSLIFLLLMLAGCAHTKPKLYPNKGTPNAKVTARSKSEFLLRKSLFLEIFTENSACQATDLGLLEITKQDQPLALPVGKIVNINVLFDTRSIMGNSGSEAAVSFRFLPLVGEHYILEVIDNGRSHGFQVYRGGAEVPYLSRTSCR